MFNDVNKLSNVGEASEFLGLLILGGESLGRREKQPQKVGRREKLAEKVGRREIYPPVPPLSSVIQWVKKNDTLLQHHLLVCFCFLTSSKGFTIWFRS